jgi:hypothetical protein
LNKEFWETLHAIGERIRDENEDIAFIKKMKGESEENDR